MPKTYRVIAHENYEKVITGKRIVIDELAYDDIIDYGGCRNRITELASFQNRNRVGIRDQYVAWIGKEHKPTDLVLQAKAIMLRPYV